MHHSNQDEGYCNYVNKKKFGTKMKKKNELKKL